MEPSCILSCLPTVDIVYNRRLHSSGCDSVVQHFWLYFCCGNVSDKCSVSCLLLCYSSPALLKFIGAAKVANLSQGNWSLLANIQNVLAFANDRRGTEGNCKRVGQLDYKQYSFQEDIPEPKSPMKTPCPQLKRNTTTRTISYNSI